MFPFLLPSTVQVPLRAAREGSMGRARLGVRTGAHSCGRVRTQGLALLPRYCAGPFGCPPRCLAKLRHHLDRPPLAPSPGRPNPRPRRDP
jgi:hypothetical protein